ncbi:MAG: hypothetical protein ABIR84_01690 [Candidatus Nitrotoga sp.]
MAKQNLKWFAKSMLCAHTHAREKVIMELNRNIMKSINRVAHQLAQNQYEELRSVLIAECKAMLAAGKTKADIDSYFLDVQARGG